MLRSFRESPSNLQPVPEAWVHILRENFYLWRQMPAEVQGRLLELIQRFIAEKMFEGCAGQTITDEVKVVIAAQACLLLLGIDDYCFDGMNTILVHPGGLLRGDEEGYDQSRLEIVLGEAAPDGPICLSWWQTRWDSKRRGQTNVVVHEFAHKLAELGNSEAGRPPLVNASLAERWDAVVEKEFKRLVKDEAYDRPTLIDPYGAESRNEFFSVVTEVFFLRPRALRRRHPELFELFAACYRVDPSSWPLTAEDKTEAREREREYGRHALAECDAALKRNPNSVDLLVDRAGLFLSLEEYGRAAEDWSAVLAQAASDEDRAIAHFERGEVHFHAENLDLAVEDFSAAIRLSPDYARAWSARAAVHAWNEKYRKALEDLREAIRLDPRDDAAYAARADVYLDLDKPEKALRDFDKAIRLSPWEVGYYRDRAEALKALGREQDAQRDLQYANELEQDDL